MDNNYLRTLFGLLFIIALLSPFIRIILRRKAENRLIKKQKKAFKDALKEVNEEKLKGE